MTVGVGLIEIWKCCRRIPTRIIVDRKAGLQRYPYGAVLLRVGKCFVLQIPGFGNGQGRHDEKANACQTRNRTNECQHRLHNVCVCVYVWFNDVSRQSMDLVDGMDRITTTIRRDQYNFVSKTPFEKVSKSAFSLGEFPVIAFGVTANLNHESHSRWFTDHTTELHQTDRTVLLFIGLGISRSREKPGEGERVVHHNTE